ncbi:histidinol-phosphatase [Clostridium sp. B9]|uniref:histidinol-phosphatase n=1 Tax=Clostridium sp. B9 TaxID=3423224 RepID=UPI003D2F32F9
MLKKINFHTHTKRCKHAVGEDIDYINKALENNISKLGFSDHGPYPDNRFGLRMNFNELDEYHSTLSSFKERFKDSIEIKVGLEIEYLNSDDYYYNYLVNELNFDYLGLGQHMFLNEDGELKHTYSLESTQDYIEYAKSICEGIKTNYFSFIAHPDLIFINDFPWDENCEEACNLIIDTAKKYDFILEFNANGLRRGLTKFCDGERYPYPHEAFWKKVSQKGVKTIINSDCHNPKDLWDSTMEEAYKLAKSLNLNIVYDIN